MLAGSISNQSRSPPKKISSRARVVTRGTRRVQSRVHFRAGGAVLSTKDVTPAGTAQFTYVGNSSRVGLRVAMDSPAFLIK